MSGGPIYPCSIRYLDSGKVFPNQFVTATNVQPFDGNGVMASLDAEATVQLMFPLPVADPGGTLKAEIISIADVAATQSAFLRLLWKAIAAGETIDLAEGSLNDEHSGGDLEIEHTTSDDNEPKSNLVTLDAEAVTYGTDKFILMNIVLKNTNWDLAVVWTFTVALTWGL